jgi:hypothetical protein
VGNSFALMHIPKVVFQVWKWGVGGPSWCIEAQKFRPLINGSGKIREGARQYLWAQVPGAPETTDDV